MTDEPNKAGRVRQSVMAALLAALMFLSALAFLAGCKSEPPKTGYLYIDDNLVVFVEWTQTGRKIEGTMEGWASSPYGKAEFSMHKFDGMLEGKKVYMTLNYPANPRGDAITGALRGNTLALPLVDGAGPTEFRRATFTEYVDAYRNLYMRTMAKQQGAKQPPNPNPTKQGS